ncbi:hypothetical protein KFK09_012734 [Dendrobium nobile]|uniref:Uncharacterized protein n=1 Tax=Dendrobium nobile TaxID=94219 RepID=A0A8T3BLN2_DENNO|nr:hypothetical protein KFK09_012734 [Dendrobium nobile]
MKRTQKGPMEAGRPLKIFGGTEKDHGVSFIFKPERSEEVALALCSSANSFNFPSRKLTRAFSAS